MQQHVSQQGDINIQTVGEMLVSAATMCRHAKGRADAKPIKKPDQLVDVEAELRRGVFGERRKQLLRRQKHFEESSGGGSSSGAPMAPNMDPVGVSRK
eukprot:3947463-Pyramimonas_sp.AAC.1